MNDRLATFYPWAELAGRILLALIFITSGWSKIGGYEATQSYMTSMGVPGALLPLVILTELGGGLLIVAGLFTRGAALTLAGFSLLSAVLFHGADDMTQQIMFAKNLSIAGGFLVLLANGAGPISLDWFRARGRKAKTGRRPASVQTGSVNGGST